MATTLTKLFPTGVLQTRVELNEVTYNSIKVGPTGVYAALFDEVHPPDGVAERRTSTGTYLVSGYFDEVTLAPPPPVTYYTDKQIFGDPSYYARITRLGGRYTDGTHFNDAIFNDLIVVGSRVIVKWINQPAEIDMGIVTLVSKTPYSFTNQYVYVTNPTNFGMPVLNGSPLVDYQASYFRIESP